MEEIKPKFKVGDVVKIINARRTTFNNGDFVQVLMVHDYQPENGGWYYRVAKPENLKNFRGLYDDEAEIAGGILEDRNKNRGILLGNRLSDWRAGAITGITYQELNPSGDWTQWLPLGEWQWKENGFDSLACVTFSALSILETLYFFHTGKQVNFSDRFTATLSGTTPAGNYLWKVGDSIRKDGLALEQEWSMIDNPTWATYYTMPPIKVINSARKFLDNWQVNYEFIDFTRESLLRHLKQAPIQVVFPNHAVELFATTEQVYRYFDSYGNPSFVKERSEGFVTAMKYVITKKTIMLDLYREAGREAVYAEINNKYYWISPNAKPDLEKDGLIDFSKITEINQKIIQEGSIS